MVAIISLQKEEKETTIYEEAPLTDTEEKVNEVIGAIEEKLDQELKSAAPKYPQFRRKLKTPEETTQIVHEATQALKENLIVIIDTKQAINTVQAVLQQKTDLSRDVAYNLAKEAVAADPNIVQTANRYRTLEYIRRNQLHERLTDTFRSTLAQIGLPRRQIETVIGLLDTAVDPLLTEGFTKRETGEATEIFKATIRPVLSKDGFSTEETTLVSEALAVSETTRMLQDLAKTTSSWDTVPAPLQRIAFETTVPEETRKVASEIKKFVFKFGLGPTPSTREEVKVEQLATEASTALVKKRVEIFARARGRGLRARVPVEQIIQEETPQIIERVIRESLSSERYGTDFVQKVENSFREAKLPVPLLLSIQEALETPFPQLAPSEKRKAVAVIRRLITQEILLGKVVPKDEASIEGIARATVEEMIKEIQASPFPAEKPNQVRAAVFQGLHTALEQYGEKYPSLVRKIEKGLAAAGEKLSPSLLENLRETIQALPPKLRPWEERELARIVGQNILSPDGADSYRQRIAQRKEEIEAFLCPITPRGVMGRISEEALASYLVSGKDGREEKEPALKEVRSVTDAAKQEIKSQIRRRLLNRLFRQLTGEKNPLETSQRLLKCGPDNLNFPTQFRQEIFQRFTNTFFQKNKWFKLDTYAGDLYSRFGGRAFREGLSRLTSPLRTRLNQGFGQFLKAARQILPKIGQLLNKVLPFLKQLAAPVLKALAGLLSQLASFLMGLAAQAAAWLAGAIGGVIAAIGLPVVLIIVGLLLLILIIALVVGNQQQSAFLDYPNYASSAKSGSCFLSDSTMASTALVGTFQAAGGAFKVPAGVVAGVANIEGYHLWSYGDTHIILYSEKGAQDPINCESNQCGARGPMQFLTGESVDLNKCPQACLEKDNQTGQCLRGLDIWSQYKEAVNEALNEGRDPHVCNIKDSIFAAAKMLKEKSQTSPENDCSWNKEEVYNAARGYYGKCQYTVEWGGEIVTGDYCEQVWQYYINHSTEPTIYP